MVTKRPDAPIHMKKHMKLCDESSMTNWGPRLASLFVNVPATRRVMMPDQDTQMNMIDGGEFPKSFSAELKKCVEEFGQYPLFIRGDGTSAKHDWNDSCFIRDADTDIESHVRAIIDYTFASSMAGELKNHAIFVREFIPLVYAGINAFNGFPVSLEIRCFIKNGKKQCQHNYWFDDALKDNVSKPYGDALEKLYDITDEDQKSIDLQLDIVAEVFPEYWSVDMAKGQDGLWYVIDMARGEVSFHLECDKS